MDRRTRREVDKIGLVICRCGGRHRRNILGGNAKIVEMTGILGIGTRHPPLETKL